jgi:putative ATP-binding cassette transporter
MESGYTQDVAIGRQTAVRFGRLIREFARCAVGGRATAMAVGLLLLLVAINAANVVNSYVGRDFMTAIERRDQPQFLRQALLYVAVFAVSTVVAVVYRFTEERLGLLCRHWLTHRLVGTYLDRRLYYRLQSNGGLANPDQRIADDVRALTTGTLSLCLIFLNGAFTIVAFSGVLWSISRALFVVAVGYATLGSLLAIRLGRPLIGLNYDQADREAHLRADLVHVRENAESVALLHREPHLAARLGGHVEVLTANLRRIIAVNRNLGFFTTGYNYLIQLIPALIVAPLFIRGSAEFGEIPQAAMAFAHLLGAFSLVVNQFGQLSSYAAVLARLSALADAAETAPPLGTPRIAMVEDARRLAFERLTLRAPHDERVLVRDLSLELAPGARVLVTGPQDVTAALLRAVAGMWGSGEGRVVRPGGDGIVLLPERPYFPPGTLRQLLVGPERAAGLRDEQVWDALRSAGVDGGVRRVGGLDLERDWDDVLSLEEQRLVELARALLAAPRFAVLARPDAGLGPVRAAQALAALDARGIAYLVLGNEALGPEHFEEVVEIGADGAWAATGTRAATG